MVTWRMQIVAFNKKDMPQPVTNITNEALVTWRMQVAAMEDELPSPFLHIAETDDQAVSGDPPAEGEEAGPPTRIDSDLLRSRPSGRAYAPPPPAPQSSTLCFSSP